jgi:hypothetical protein
MSTWTPKEVKAIMAKNGGGNDNCRAKWLGKAGADMDRVLPQHSLDGHKRFVDLVFNRKAYLNESGRAAAPARSSKSPSNRSGGGSEEEDSDGAERSPSRRRKKKKEREARRAAKAAAAQKPVRTTSAPAAAPSAAPNDAWDPFADDFSPPAHPTPAAAAVPPRPPLVRAQSAPTPSGGGGADLLGDLFGPSTAAPAAASGFDFLRASRIAR